MTTREIRTISSASLGRGEDVAPWASGRERTYGRIVGNRHPARSRTYETTLSSGVLRWAPERYRCGHVSHISDPNRPPDVRIGDDGRPRLRVGTCRCGALVVARAWRWEAAA